MQNPGRQIICIVSCFVFVCFLVLVLLIIIMKMEISHAISNISLQFTCAKFGWLRCEVEGIKAYMWIPGQ